MKKLSTTEAYNVWRENVIKQMFPNQHDIVEENEKRKFEENKLMRHAVEKFGGITNVANTLKKSRGYITNILKGYNPLPKELEATLKDVLCYHNYKEQCVLENKPIKKSIEWRIEMANSVQ